MQITVTKEFIDEIREHAISQSWDDCDGWSPSLYFTPLHDGMYYMPYMAFRRNGVVEKIDLKEYDMVTAYEEEL